MARYRLRRVWFFILPAIVVFGCSRQSKVESYGAEKFAKEVLEFQNTGKVNSEIQDIFSPDQVQNWGGGVLLIYHDSEHRRSGIYVDPHSLDGIGGSGVGMRPWFNNIGYVTIKKRATMPVEIPRNQNVKNEFDTKSD